MWFDNVPRLVEDKGGRNSISKKDDKFIFQEGKPQLIRDTNQYLDRISEVRFVSPPNSL